MSPSLSTKKLNFHLTILTVLLGSVLLAVVSCPAPGGEPVASAQQTFTVDAVSFKLVYVPAKTFPSGIGGRTPKTVPYAYWIGETEVTYKLWSVVYTWATLNGYTFANAGICGSAGSGSDQQPATTVNWRDAIVWCNAATEWYNAKNYSNHTCVYVDSSSAIIRDSRDSNSVKCDEAVAGGSATGFRLCTSAEWELAARWRNDATNTVFGYSNPWFTRDDSASGATTYYNDNTNGSGEPAKSANDAVAVYSSYWNGSGWIPTGVTGTAAVKSKGINGANSLGLYDMSGNVGEWCSDWYSDSERVLRSSAWSESAFDLQVYRYYTTLSSNTDNVWGFRLAKSAS